MYEVKRLACFASEYENDFIKAMIGRSAKVAENTALRKQRALDALTARDRELDMLFERLYEDNVAGKIDDARFAKMSKRYEQEQGENAKKIKALRLELKKDESKRMDIDDFLETVRRYTDATTITKRMVAELIDHIEVYHAEKQDGITNQRVDITTTASALSMCRIAGRSQRLLTLMGGDTDFTAAFSAVGHAFDGSLTGALDDAYTAVFGPGRRSPPQPPTRRRTPQRTCA